MSKTIDFSKELAAVKRSNKEARERRAILRGYKTAADYIAYLETQIKIGSKKSTVSSTKTPSGNSSTTKNSKKTKVNASKIYKTIHIVDILDKSGSMHDKNKFKTALEGIKLKVTECCKDTSMTYKHTVILFDTVISEVLDGNTISEKNVLKLSAFSPSGRTALNDVIYYIYNKINIAGTFDLSTQKVLINIYTDGEENASTASALTAATAIKAMEEKGILTTFIGTKQDCKIAIKQYHIDESNTLSHDNTEKSLTKAFQSNVRSTITYSTNVAKGLDVSKGFYKTIKK